MLTGGQPAKWAKALYRAECYKLIATKVDEIADGPNVWEYWRAKSTSREGIAHGVRVEATAAGVDVSCSCEGGAKGYICMHAAFVARLAGFLPDVMLVESMPDRPLAA